MIKRIKPLASIMRHPVLVSGIISAAVLVGVAFAVLEGPLFEAEAGIRVEQQERGVLAGDKNVLGFYPTLLGNHALAVTNQANSGRAIKWVEMDNTRKTESRERAADGHEDATPAIDARADALAAFDDTVADDPEAVAPAGDLAFVRDPAAAPAAPAAGKRPYYSLDDKIRQLLEWDDLILKAEQDALSDIFAERHSRALKDGDELVRLVTDLAKRARDEAGKNRREPGQSQDLIARKAMLDASENAEKAAKAVGDIVAALRAFDLWKTNTAARRESREEGSDAIEKDRTDIAARVADAADAARVAANAAKDAKDAMAEATDKTKSNIADAAATARQQASDLSTSAELEAATAAGAKKALEDSDSFLMALARMTTDMAGNASLAAAALSSLMEVDRRATDLYDRARYLYSEADAMAATNASEVVSNGVVAATRAREVIANPTQYIAVDGSALDAFQWTDEQQKELFEIMGMQPFRNLTPEQETKQLEALTRVRVQQEVGRHMGDKDSDWIERLLDDELGISPAERAWLDGIQVDTLAEDGTPRAGLVARIKRAVRRRLFPGEAGQQQRLEFMRRNEVERLEMQTSTLMRHTFARALTDAEAVRLTVNSRQSPRPDNGKVPLDAVMLYNHPIDDLANALGRVYTARQRAQRLSDSFLRYRSVLRQRQDVERKLREAQSRHDLVMEQEYVSLASDLGDVTYDKLVEHVQFLANVANSEFQAVRGNLEVEAALTDGDIEKRIFDRALSLTNADHRFVKYLESYYPRRLGLLGRLFDLKVPYPPLQNETKAERDERVRVSEIMTKREISQMDRNARREAIRIAENFYQQAFNEDATAWGKLVGDYQSAEVKRQAMAKAYEMVLSYGPERANRFLAAAAIRSEIDNFNDQIKTIEITITNINAESKAPTSIYMQAPAQAPFSVGSRGVKIMLVIIGMGLFLAVALATAIDHLDPRVMNPGDINAVVGFPPFGYIMERVDRETSMFADEQLRMLALKFYQMVSHGRKMFLVTSVKHGGGATRTVLDIAAALTRLGLNTVVVESNRFKPDAGAYSDGRRRPCLEAFLRGEAPLADVVIRGEEGMPDRIATGEAEGMSRRHIIFPKETANQLQVLRNNYDVILLDTAPVMMSADTQFLCTVADAIVLVVPARVAVLGEVRRAMGILNRVDGKPPVAVLLNRVPVDRHGGYFREMLAEFQRGVTQRSGLASKLFYRN